jgi:midasin (ATPase involved in ribosome maturation)
MEVKDNKFISTKITFSILHEIYDTFIAYIYSKEVREACLKLIIGELSELYLESNWEGIDAHELVENFINQNSRFSFSPEDKSFYFGRSMEYPIVNNFFHGFVVESFVNVIEQITVGISMNETMLLVGETGTGKTTIVQNIAHVMGKKLNVFNMSQNTDSADLMGGFKPIDTRLLIKPLYLDFLELFNSLFDQGKNIEFIKMTVNYYNKSKNTEFFK